MKVLRKGFQEIWISEVLGITEISKVFSSSAGAAYKGSVDQSSVFALAETSQKLHKAASSTVKKVL
jgi:hypothetical protein